MSMDLFRIPLSELASARSLTEDIKVGRFPVQAGGCVPTQKAHIIHELGKDRRWRLVCAGSEQAAREMYEDCAAFDDKVYYYPCKDLIFYQADVRGRLQAGQRLRVMKAICEDEGGTIVVSMEGLMNVLPGLDSWKRHSFCVSEAGVVDMDKMAHELVTMGYERRETASEQGQFAMRGSIIDIYPFTEENPIRIDLFDNEVDSIKYYDAGSQRSIDRLESINIYPASEFVMNTAVREMGLKKIKSEYEKAYEAFKKDGNYEAALNLKNSVGEVADDSGIGADDLLPFMNYFGEKGCSLIECMPQDTIIFASEPDSMSEFGDNVFAEFTGSAAFRLSGGYMLKGQGRMIFEPREVFALLKERDTVLLTGLATRAKAVAVKSVYDLGASSAVTYKDNITLLIHDLQKWRREKYRVIILYASRTKAARMAGYLQDYELDAFYSQSDEEVLPGQVMIRTGSLRGGFNYPQIKFIVLAEADISGRRSTKSASVRHKGRGLNSLDDLTVGDYVVHENYGIGIFRGIERKFSDHNWRDYIKIEYGDDSSLFIPATQFEYIQKYGDSSRENVKLSSLYGSEWKKTKARVKAGVEKTAEELVELYAARMNKKGYRFGPDTLWQREFEEAFPYEETDDQLKVIAQVKADMESDRIMDRLICADVGFGKTEIALRAAFKAAQDGKQSAYLVPTTILAQQHYNTFTQRIGDYPVHVVMLSRFCTPAQMKQALTDIRTGRADIVIGTHRLLSKDVQFKDLGLLMIDEEQRFGVAHKEKIKQLKNEVDVITMTATPIPRTLHMSLIGVRDMSVMEQAPTDRLPIQTYVCEHTKELVREAIVRELSRGGQVYYVYNRVTNIAHVAQELKDMLPDANIAFAHGQMGERQLERIMVDFVNGVIDVLVSTTIIETGLDIANVNTIIIDDADRFGLSQLYQLRGRVGRSSRTAYAFILYRQNKSIKEEAQQRLEAIRQFTELGSGVKIALKDLEIRGAGNVLGHAQHGHLEAVGYDLYCKMLREAVGRLSGKEEKTEKPQETFIDINIDAFIPDSYIESEKELLDIYKRITMIASRTDYEEMVDELIDRFGDIPPQTQNLLSVALLKALSGRIGAQKVRADAKRGAIYFGKDASLNAELIPGLLKEFSGALRVSAGDNVVFTYTRRERDDDLSAMVEKLLGIVEKLSVS